MKKEFKEGNITIAVDYDKCIGAGECITACPVEIFKLENGKAVCQKVEECIECCACVNACPKQAISHSSC
ncbi:MAG: 4Fe-4S binding protein [Methanobacteriota archaeon]